MTDLTERLRDYSTCLQGAAWSRQDGGQDLSIGSILAEEAATTLETLTQEVERLRELCDAACSNAEMALNFLAEAGRPELAETQAIYVANIRKALGGGDE